MQDEGHDVSQYILPDNRTSPVKTGLGIIPRINTLELQTLRDAVIIFDENDSGKLADQLRRSGKKVLNGGMFCTKLERDRSYGITIAKEIGLSIPPYTEFTSISDAQAFVTAHPDKKFYFKSDRYLESDATRAEKTVVGMVGYLEDIKERFGNRISCILQESVSGTALSTAWYWNGTSMVQPIQGTIEHKKYLNGDLGPSTGCQFNVVWFYPDSRKIGALLHLDRMEEIWRREKAPPGLYDINAIITPGGEPYFLEWTPRFGYDSEPTAQLLCANLATLYAGVVSGKIGELPVVTGGAAAYGVRVSVPPYPWEYPDSKKQSADIVGNRITLPGKQSLYKGFIAYEVMIDKNQLKVADEYGLLGIVGTAGTDLEKMHKTCMKLAESIDISGLSYRTDGAEVLTKDMKALRSALPGYGIPVL